MPIHKSLVTRGKLTKHRNVLTRAERIARLLGDERWKEGDNVFGLPKVSHMKMKARKKVKKVVAAEGTVEGAAAVPGAPAAAAPAAGAAKPAAGAKPAAKPAK